MKKIIATAIAFGVSVAVLVGGIAFVHHSYRDAPAPVQTAAVAGPNADTAFLTVLASKNVGITSPADGVTMGHRVCDALTVEGVNRWLEGTRLVSVGYTGDEAATIVGASVASYCQGLAVSYVNQSGY